MKLLALFAPIMVIVGFCLLASLECATVTDPPPAWGPQTSCADDPTGPTCVHPIHDRRD